MQSEGIRKLSFKLLLVSAALLLGSQAFAQHALTNLPRLQAGDDDPIAFMGPHYIIHQTQSSTLSSPPTTAFSPNQIRHAYGFDQLSNQGAHQIIGIVDAYDDPKAENDLGVFSKQYGLPACTTSNGCFRKVFASGRQPAVNQNWAVEISLDIEWAHAIAPQATILLVEAKSNNLSDLLNGVDVAVRDGASVVSMSWTAYEFSSEASLDNHFVSNTVTFFAASGDAGTGVAYPSASPFVIGVGGTSLALDARGNYKSETAWSGSGGGLSAFEHEPLFQAEFAIPDDGSGRRGAPDVAFNANPGTGYAVYDSYGINGVSGWFQIGGTSASSPQWAAMVAIANSMRVTARKTNLLNAEAFLYTLAKSSAAANFRPVTSGTNGNCGTLCTAMPGYDFVTGLGTPNASGLINALVAH
ncbi:MAG TPA: S53 family peptidase [Candidatus Acidoferrales bacterium]|nr:S53 family peptidase [Candidatus Acidoferrales bacterium]